MEWTRMQENKYDDRTIFRVFKTYEKLMLLSFLLCISLVVGAILAIPVAGDKKPLLFENKQETEGLGGILEEAQVQSSGKNELTVDNLDDPYGEPISTLEKNMKRNRTVIRKM